MSTITAGSQEFFKPTSVTIIRRDPLPSQGAGLNALARVARFIESVSLVASSTENKDKVRPDVTKQQSHEFAWTPTRNAVPRGEKITNHITREPARLTFQGLITDSPLRPEGIGSPVLPGLNRAVTELNKLKRFADERELVFVATSTFIYEQMAITRLIVPRNMTSGGSVNVSVTLEEVKIVSEFRDKVADDLASQLGSSMTVPSILQSGI